jgi:hypothetical protein
MHIMLLYGQIHTGNWLSGQADPEKMTAESEELW